MLGVSIALFTTPRRPRRWRVVAVQHSEKSQRTQNGTMFVDLDWPLNASRRLSASAELLVCFSITRQTKLIDCRTCRTMLSYGIALYHVCIDRCLSFHWQKNSDFYTQPVLKVSLNVHGPIRAGNLEWKLKSLMKEFWRSSLHDRQAVENAYQLES